MFGFLKKKLQEAVSSLGKKVEEEGVKKDVEVPVEGVKLEKKAKPKKHKEPAEEEVPGAEEPIEEAVLEVEPEPVLEEVPEPESAPEPVKEKPGFFKRLFGKKEEEPVKEETPEPEEAKEEPEEAKETGEVEEVPEPVQEIETPVETKRAKKEEHKKVHRKEELGPQEETVPVRKEDVEVRPEPKKEEVKVEAKKHEVPQTPTPQERKEAPAPEEKKGFFSRLTQKITTTTISKPQFEQMFCDLELALLENNVAIEVIDKMKKDLSEALVDKPLRRGTVETEILTGLKGSVAGLFAAKPINLIEEIKHKDGPYVICFVGINGTGKTTTIAKVAKMLQDLGISVVMAACDTFRAAAIDQLQSHADKLGVKLVKHDYGADPAAVAFDAIAHAKKTGKKVVLIDTAGRLHSNVNLMEELHKIVRVAKPDLKIFIGESVTGNDCVVQAQKFNETVGIDGIVLSKADVDEKGGAALSVSYVTGKPIMYLGTGQGYGDLEPFDAQKMIARLGV